MSKAPAMLSSLQEKSLKLPVGDYDLHASSHKMGVTLLIKNSQGYPELQMEIELTPSGPVVRTCAARLEVCASEEVVTRCRNFRIEAEAGIHLRSAGVIELDAHDSLNLSGASITQVARRENVTVRANDDVQLLGEHILLNCEKEMKLPSWVPTCDALQSLGQSSVEKTSAMARPDVDKSGVP